MNCELIVNFNLTGNWWVSQLQKSEFAVLVLGFGKFGLELDNCGRTTKYTYCRIYSLRCEESDQINEWRLKAALRSEQHFGSKNGTKRERKLLKLNCNVPEMKTFKMRSELNSKNRHKLKEKYCIIRKKSLEWELKYVHGDSEKWEVTGASG